MYYARKPAILTKIRKPYGKTVQVDGFELQNKGWKRTRSSSPSQIDLRIVYLIWCVE